ncbi:hypothetical protein EAH78_19360 [Pseudomonas arsenicoxydans]|uniref:Uncharacterized protein n=1 Tax=Pseudomonas arsenicoxydans TaxID=702115 RepID=A0A502HPX1_9PSED|nr:hypothetical protein EAH78_19360 [Pseudomonas arsenicoxydans]
MSLLAIAVCQSTSLLNVPPLSRAGSLLRGNFVGHKNLCPTAIKCGSGLAREKAITFNKDVD